MLIMSVGFLLWGISLHNSAIMRANELGVYEVCKSPKDAPKNKLSYIRQKAINDSIDRVKKARADSIAAVKAREKAIADSLELVRQANLVKKWSKRGLILCKHWLITPEKYYEPKTIGYGFKVFNPTNKRIKYVKVGLYGINAVEDRETLKEMVSGMGPVEPHEYSTWKFKGIFDNDSELIDNLRIVSFEVIYWDNSKKWLKVDDIYCEESDFSPSWFERN